MTRRQLISIMALLTLGAGVARAQERNKPKLETVSLIITGMT